MVRLSAFNVLLQKSKDQCSSQLLDIEFMDAWTITVPRDEIIGNTVLTRISGAPPLRLITALGIGLRGCTTINYRIRILAEGRKPSGLQHRTACAVPLTRQLIDVRRLSHAAGKITINASLDALCFGHESEDILDAHVLAWMNWLARFGPVSNNADVPSPVLQN